MRVPRRKPDEVIVHRIELGVYERERLDLMVAGNVFNKVSNPIVNLLSDVSGLAALVGILEAVGVLNIRKYIKANTPLDEWANSVIGGLFAGFDEAMAALDTAFEQTRMLISEVEGIEIPSIDIPTTEEWDSLTKPLWVFGHGPRRQFKTHPRPRRGFPSGLQVGGQHDDFIRCLRG